MVRRLTGKDVARQAGVSPSAVSRAFTDSNRLNTETRDHILKVAQEMGYRPNALARSLIKQQSDLIAIVSGHMDNLYDLYFFNYLSDQLQKAGKWGLLIRAQRDESIADALSKALAYPVQAAIVRAGTLDSQVLEQCKQMQVPVIFTGLGPDVEGADTVWCNYQSGAYKSTRRLIDIGCKQIAYLGGLPGNTASTGRQEGFEKAMQEAGMKPHSMLSGEHDFEQGLRRGQKLLTSSPPPDGVFCFADAIALGLMNTAQAKLGLEIPKDVAITSCDNIPMASWPMFSLTTSTNPLEEIVHAIMKVLDQRLENPTAPEISVVIEPELILRNSA